MADNTSNNLLQNNSADTVQAQTSHEIDVVAVAMKVFKEWKTLLCFLGVSGVIGVVVALENPKTYTSEVILAPEMSSGGLGLSDNLADMASSFGIELGGKSSMDAIYPEIYPDIFSSVDFMHSLFNVKVRLKDDNTERTYYDHITKEVKSPFWDLPKMWLAKALQKPEAPVKGAKEGDVDPFRMPRKDLEVCEGMAKAMTCLIDKKTSEISISVTDQDPMVAAIMADTLQRRLQAYITEYRTKKARTDYEYYDKLMNDALARYTKSKDKYANYADTHQDAVLEAVNAEEEAMRDNMSSAYDLVSTMSKMRDQAKAKIQERTPAFTIIQAPKMMYKPSSTPKIVTLFIFLVLGFVLDAMWVAFGKKLFSKKQKQVLTEEEL